MYRDKIASDELKKEMPNPSLEELDSVEFNAVWEVIKSWDINCPEFYHGYCGANGSHVKIILDAIKNARREK